MCTEPLYAIRLKTEYDVKFKKFGKRSSLTVLCAVRDIGKDTQKLSYNRKFYDLLMISCGQCLQCRLLKSKQRAIMCLCESLEHEQNSFVTLTFGYRDLYRYYRKEKKLSHYLASKKAHFHEWSLETELFRNFMKRLRFWYYNEQLSYHLIKLGRSDLVCSHIRIPSNERPFLLKDFKPKTIKYMHCGEYGSRRHRPHHHVILHGFQFPDLEPYYEDGKLYYRSKILSDLWKFGIHVIGDCTYNSCCYVARYVTKKINGNNMDEFYNGRKPEYATYSTKPILGASYFTKNYKEFANTQRLCVVADKKYECALPKSYDNLLKKIDIDRFNKMKEERVTSCTTDLDVLLKSKRSIYSKLDDNMKISFAVLKKLVRSYEAGAEDYDEYFKKAKAFGISPQFFTSEYCDNAIKFLSRKSFKDHKKISTNEKMIKLYRDFENRRKRLINQCYDVRSGEEFVQQQVNLLEALPNPFKCRCRGKTYDNESIDKNSYIDEKGKEIIYE